MVEITGRDALTLGERGRLDAVTATDFGAVLTTTRRLGRSWHGEFFGSAIALGRFVPVG
jgi:hypothetical protein